MGWNHQLDNMAIHILYIHIFVFCPYICTYTSLDIHQGQAHLLNAWRKNISSRWRVPPRFGHTIQNSKKRRNLNSSLGMVVGWTLDFSGWVTSSIANTPLKFNMEPERKSWKRRFLLETIIFRFHVIFRGSIDWTSWHDNIIFLRYDAAAPETRIFWNLKRFLFSKHRTCAQGLDEFGQHLLLGRWGWEIAPRRKMSSSHAKGGDIADGAEILLTSPHGNIGQYGRHFHDWQVFEPSSLMQEFCYQ